MVFERQSIGERGMVAPVRAVLNNPKTKFDITRINYGRCYTVEHNWKVNDVGNVHKDHMALFVSQWRSILEKLCSSKDVPRGIGTSWEGEDFDTDTVESSDSDNGGPFRNPQYTQSLASVQDRKFAIASVAWARDMSSVIADLGDTPKPEDKSIGKSLPKFQVFSETNQDQIHSQIQESGINLKPRQAAARDTKQENSLAEHGKVINISHNSSQVEGEVSPQKAHEKLEKYQQLFAEQELKISMLQKDLELLLNTGSNITDDKYAYDTNIKFTGSTAPWNPFNSYDRAAVPRSIGKAITTTTFSKAPTSVFSRSGIEPRWRSPMTSVADEDERDIGLGEKYLRSRSAVKVMPGSDSGSRHEPETQELTADSEAEEEESDESSESDTDTIDIPRKPSQDSNERHLDERIVDPRKWNSRLAEMEERVCKISTAEATARHLSELLQLTECSSIMDGVLENIVILQAAGFCGKSISYLLELPNRPGVAALAKVDVSFIREAARAIDQEDVLQLDLILRELGLLHVVECSAATTRTRFMATLLARLLDLIIVSYSGAHLERFDRKYFQVQNQADEIKLIDRFVMRRRSLQCLDEFLHQEQVWVFQFVGTEKNVRSEASLYLLTTPELFADIWGPMWAVSKLRQANLKSENSFSEPPQSVLKYNLLNGYLVPWTRQEHEPTVRPGEFFAHWIKSDDSISDQQGFPSSSEIGPLQLLIGAKTQFKKNPECPLSTSIDSCTRHLRKDNRMLHPATSRGKVHVDSQQVQIGIQPQGVGLNTTTQFKARAGFSLKDAIVAEWTNTPYERNPWIVWNFYGVEVSACTYNTRRKRLARILGSPIMRNYLEGVFMAWPSPECKDKYFDSLNDSAISFPEFYSDANTPKDWRDAMGQAVAASLKALSTTGNDENNNLTALWAPNPRDRWKVTIRKKQQHWAGVLKDTVETCSFGIFTTVCWEFKPTASMWESTCQSSSSSAQNPPIDQRPVLETALVINEEAKMPRGLELNDITRRWKIHRLENRATFDLGKCGRIKYLFHFGHRRRALVSWDSPSIFESPLSSVLESLDHPLKHHYELGLMSCEPWPTEHISIYVTSQK
jgi:hypothetical protein